MISFEPTEEQRLLTATASKFARERIRPIAREADETGALPLNLLEDAWQLGFVQAAIPEQLGGYGGQRSALDGAMFVEELAYGDLSFALAAMAPGLLAFPLLSEGSDVQRRLFLSHLAGEKYPYVGAALIEPVYQFDANDLDTKAKRSSSGYVLDGLKCCVPFADLADRLLIYANDVDAGGTQAFVVDRSVDGLEVGAREAYMGLKALPTYGLKLTSCVVPEERRLGGAGGCDFGRIAAGYRLALSAMAVGVAKGSFEYARDYAKQRQQFGEPIASRQAIAFMLADMAIDVDATRLLAWEAAWKIDRGEDGTRAAYLAKLFADDAVLKTADGAVQVLGGHGYIREHPVELWLRNARGFANMDGLAIV